MGLFEPWAAPIVSIVILTMMVTNTITNTITKMLTKMLTKILIKMITNTVTITRCRYVPEQTSTSPGPLCWWELELVASMQEFTLS